VLKKLNLSLAVVTILALCGGLRADGEKPLAGGLAADLKATIKSGLEMLKDGKSDAFLERFVMPDDMEKIKQSGHLDEIKKGFKEKSALVAKLFEAIQDSEPKFSDGGATATYDIPKIDLKGAPGLFSSEVKQFHFKKIKDKWYIGEH
jgi:hypothetical protein